MLTLALIAAGEAVVYLLRYRSASQKCWMRSAVHGFLIAATRVVWLEAGVSALLNDAPVLHLVLAYAGTAGMVTGALHWWLERGRGC